MPELPEVETMVRGVRQHCENRRLTAVEFCPCPRQPIPVFPDRDSFGQLHGTEIQTVGRLGKRVLLNLNSGDVIVIEPRMTGLLLVSAPPTELHLRLILHLQPVAGLAAQVRFWDRRGLGTVSLLNAARMQALRNRLGPDALEMNISEWKQRLSRTSRPIKVALLEQSLVAGIGNLYASEILHLAGIAPGRRADRVRGRQLQAMDEAVRQVLQTAIRYEGSTLNDGTYRNALNQDGGYQNHHRVYDREGELCPTCGLASIRRIVQAQRSTFYCPKCQR
ncbi:MAG: bifunctional DNA-formamidopyrimidine glycosylase/DNA-(apurinic or apyrimidinic site) lyase [Planctomycetaceae bacterium]